MNRSALLVAIVAIAAGVVIADGHVIRLGLFSDDFQWLIGAQQFDAKGLLPSGAATHFIRPFTNLFFVAAFGACGYSSGCLHGAVLVVHGAAGLLVALLVFSLARNAVVSIIAGVLFVVQPGPTEALTWLAAASEVFGAFLYVLTFWLFRLALEAGGNRREGSYFLALVCCYACMLTHEAGVTLVPMLFFSAWMFPVRKDSAEGSTPSAAWLAPFGVVWAICVAMLCLSAVRSNNITGGLYAIGLHMPRNIFGGLVSLAVASRHSLGFAAVGGFYLWALLLAPQRIRFWAIWAIVTMLPFAGFRDYLPSRYFYLSAIGFAALIAETLWWLRERLPGQRALAAAVYVVALFIAARFAVFERRNVHIWDAADESFREYVAAVRRLYPTVPPGSTIVVPRPPEEKIGERYVSPFLQWEYRDPTLRVIFGDR